MPREKGRTFRSILKDERGKPEKEPEEPQVAEEWREEPALGGLTGRDGGPRCPVMTPGGTVVGRERGCSPLAREMFRIWVEGS